MSLRKAQTPLLSGLTALRIDTPIEVDYYTSDGILPLVLKKIVNK